jgi:hypothetical protein
MSTPPSEPESSAEGSLRELRAHLRKMKVSAKDMLRIEEDIQTRLNALGRELMLEVFSKADIDDPEVFINGILHGRVDRHDAKVHTSFGVCEVGRTTYRKDRESPTVAPFDKALGIVEGFYTPKCASVLCLLPALLVRNDQVTVLAALGRIDVGAATMHRLPQAVMARYEGRRDLVERAVRDRDSVPVAAAYLQVGLDGVMVPQEGELCKPRGRKTDEEPAPARWENKYPGATPPGPAGSDGRSDLAWHEASVGTLAYFDEAGVHLHTTYLGRMPEERKETLGELLEAEVQHALARHPDLTPILASDGAQGQWTILAGIQHCEWQGSHPVGKPSTPSDGAAPTGVLASNESSVRVVGALPHPNGAVSPASPTTQTTANPQPPWSNMATSPEL